MRQQMFRTEASPFAIGPPNSKMVLLRTKPHLSCQETVYFIAQYKYLTAEPNHCIHSPMIHRKPIRITLLATILTSFFFGFATKNFAADKLRISYSAVNATQAFLWVAQEKGFFAKHGLEGELLYINSGTMNIAALVGGSVQVAGGGPVSIEARLRGVKLLILGNPLPWLASNLVTNPDIKS